MNYNSLISYCFYLSIYLFDSMFFFNFPELLLIFLFPGISGGSTPPKAKFGKKLNEESRESQEEDSLDDSEVPKNFLVMHNNNIVSAKKAFIKSLKWRKENNVNNILTTKQNNFHDILLLYPHALHRFSLDGCAVAYELLGKAKPKEMKKKGISSENLTWHFLMRNELLFQKYLPDGFGNNIEGNNNNSNNNNNNNYYDNNYNNNKNIINSNNNLNNQRQHSLQNNVPAMGRMLTVLDVKGVSVSDITTDVIAFIKQSSEIMDSYYPGKCALEQHSCLM